MTCKKRKKKIVGSEVVWLRYLCREAAKIIDWGCFGGTIDETVEILVKASKGKWREVAEQLSR